MKVDPEKLRALVKASGRPAATISAAAGLGSTAIKDILRGQSRDPAVGTLFSIARELGCDLADLLTQSEADGRGGMIERLRPISRRVPIVGSVEAGTWREVVLDQIVTPTDFVPVDLPEYSRATLCAFLVSGNSMNLYYPAGTYVVAVPVAEAGVQYGDRVIVRRDRAGLTEMTVKELVQEGSRAFLWPRSTDPEHQTPIAILPSEDDQDAPVITHVVVASYSTHNRSGIAFRPDLVTE